MSGQGDVLKGILFYYYLISFLCSLPLAVIMAGNSPMGSALSAYWLVDIPDHVVLYPAYILAEASIVAPINYSGVVFAGGLGWAIWGHVPGAAALAGIVLVVGAGLLASWIGFRQSRSERLGDYREPGK